MQSKPTYKPSSQGCPHGYHFHATGGPKIGRRSIGNLWFPCYWLFMDILIVGVFGKIISIAVWVKQGWKQILPDIWHSIFSSSRAQLSFGCVRRWLQDGWTHCQFGKGMGKRQGCSEHWWPWAIWPLLWLYAAGIPKTSGCLRRHTLSHLPLKPRSQQPHNTEHKTGGSMMNQTWHGFDTTYNPEKDCTSRLMRGRCNLSKFESHNFLWQKGHIEKLS